MYMLNKGIIVACAVPVCLVEAINLACTAVYILEFVLKLFALGPRKYFASFFNKLDFLVQKISSDSLLFRIHLVLPCPLISHSLSPSLFLALCLVRAAESGGPTSVTSTLSLISTQ